MLPTFVIGLREGLEAALIVGIIAAFLRKQGRGDLLRQVAIGVGSAIAICVAGGVALQIYSQNLPQKQQEALETIIGVLAVGMVTYMVIWMKEHSRGLKAELESLASSAMTSGRDRAGMAMVAMAFLAVLREGFETAVFLLAAVNGATSGPDALIGAILGIAVSIVLGYGIYRGGVRINLSKFFRATGLVLALVAAGLVVTALHTAHEAGWLNIGQQQMVDLTWLVKPGSVLSSLLTGMLGIQPMPVQAEVIGWLLYAIPVCLFVAWPPGKALSRRALRFTLAGAAALTLGGAGLVTAWAPSISTTNPEMRDGSLSATIVSLTGSTMVLRTPEQQPLTHQVAQTPSTYTLERTGSEYVGKLYVSTYELTTTVVDTSPTTMKVDDLVALNDGRLPLGVVTTAGTVPVIKAHETTLSVGVDPTTKTIADLTWKQEEQVRAVASHGQQIPSARPLTTATTTMSPQATQSALAHATAVATQHEERAHRLAWARVLEILGGTSILGFALTWFRRRRPAESITETTPDATTDLHHVG